MAFNIFLCGVGGQGLALMTSVIGNACAKTGKKAITGEMYGLSQRSGAVFVHMRIGDDAFSPLIPYGEASVIVALEAIESLRYVEYLKPEGIILVNRRVIHPPIETSKLVLTKESKYITLEQIVEQLKKWTQNVTLVDALNLAKQTGNSNTENTVFLGCLSMLKAFPVDETAMRESVTEAVPKKTVDQNLTAFELGRKTAYDDLCRRVECNKL